MALNVRAAVAEMLALDDRVWLGELVRLARPGPQRLMCAWRNRAYLPSLMFDPAGPIVILSPHLDDAVLSCWSVITGDRPVVVVNVFARVPRPGPVAAWDSICGARDPAEHARARLAEDREVLEPLVGSPANLPVPDEEHRRGAPVPLVTLDRHLRQAVSRASVVYAPAALGYGHGDHRLTRALARELARTGMPVWLYADLPYAVRYGWPPWVTGLAPRPHLNSDAYWRPSLSELDQLGANRQPRIVHLDGGQAARKLDAMRSYRTQFPALDASGVLSNPRHHSYEVFWRLGAGGLDSERRLRDDGVRSAAGRGPRPS